MTEQMKQLRNYILKEVVRRSDVELNEDTPLVSSGLIDSFALITVLVELERITQLRIPAGKIQAKDMDTMRLMFETAERVGKRKN